MRQFNRPVSSRTLRRSGLVAAAAALTALGTAGGAHAAGTIGPLPTTGTSTSGVSGSPASTQVSFAVNSSARTLSLTDGMGNALNSGTVLNANNPNTPFGVKVNDQSEGLQPFNVYATMSNLYSYNTATNAFQCPTGTSFPSIASTGVGLSEPAGSTVESSVAAVTDPVFSLTGSLTSTVVTQIQTAVATALGTPTSLPLVGGTLNQATGAVTGGSATAPATTAVNAVINGLVPQTLNDLGNGSLVSGILGTLPINATEGPAGTFATPDAFAGSGCSGGSSTTATAIPVMVGTANANGIIADLQKLLGSANLSGLTSGTTPQISANQISDALAATLKLTPLGSTTPVTGGALLADLGGPASTQWQSVVSQLNAALNTATTAANTLIGGLNPLVSGNYSNSPRITVTPGSVPAGNYRGQMTVTLMDIIPA